MSFRVYANCDIGEAALNLLRKRGYQVEVHAVSDPPPKTVIVEKVRSGIDGLITTLPDDIASHVSSEKRDPDWEQTAESESDDPFFSRIHHLAKLLKASFHWLL